jgi:pimeloyl-ACP methyl ester carboxylesterase
LPVEFRPASTPPGMRGRAALLTHDMPGVTKATVRATTLLFTPDGGPPPGGRRVVLWSHGSTTPGCRDCAPSLSPDFDGGLTRDGFKSDYAFQLTTLVNAGYAVLAPDFEGIGPAADAPHPGFNSRSIANALMAGLAAGRATGEGLSDDFVVVGHSEGARALIGLEQHIDAASRETLRGAVALAPFTSMRAVVEGIEAARQTPGADAGALVALQNFIVCLVATGLSIQDPTFEARDIMGPDLAEVFPSLRTLCAAPAIGAVTAAVQTKGAEAFAGVRPDWYQACAVKSFLAANDPAEMPNLEMKRPMLVVAGTEDPFVPLQPLRELVARMVGGRAPVTLDVQEGGDHFSIIRSAQPAILAFVARMFEGQA